MNDPSDLEEIKSLLTAIRDNQVRALAKQEEHLDLARRQMQQARERVEESIRLQRDAVAKQQAVTKVAVPAILACIAAIVYLVLRYF